MTKVADGLRIDGRFTPPAEAADDLTFWLASEGADGWSTYVGARGFNLAMLDQIPGLPLPATAQGRGDVRLWVDTESARLTRITAELDMSDVRSPALGGADEAAEDPVFAGEAGFVVRVGEHGSEISSWPGKGRNGAPTRSWWSTAWRHREPGSS